MFIGFQFGLELSHMLHSGSSFDFSLSFAALTFRLASGCGGSTRIGWGLLGFILICVFGLMLRGSNCNLRHDCNAKNVAKPTLIETTLTACGTCLQAGLQAGCKSGSLESYWNGSGVLKGSFSHRLLDAAPCFASCEIRFCWMAGWTFFNHAQSL